MVGALADSRFVSALNSAAAIVLCNERGEVLLVKENYGRERWGLPGGFVEDGESPTEAAVREAAEEIGLTVKLDHLIGLYHLRHEPGGTRFRASGLRFIFAGRIVSGEPTVPDTGEIADCAWFASDDLPAHTTHTAPLGVQDAADGRVGVLRELIG